MHHMIRRDGERTVAKAPALHRVWTRLEPLKGHVRIIGGAAIAYPDHNCRSDTADPCRRMYARERVHCRQFAFVMLAEKIRREDLLL